jgi:FtsZ-interacting cell division protein ZipA
MKKTITIITIIALFSIALTGCKDNNTNTTSSDTATMTDASETDANSESETNENTIEADQDIASETNENEDISESDTLSVNGETSTENNSSKKSSTTQAATTSTPAATTQTTAETSKSSTTSTPAATSHTHSWTPVYATMEVDQLASDGTNNDYSKPIYETVTYETEAYETHWFNGDVDLTVATANYNASHGTNLVCSDRYTDMDFNIYLNDLGAVYGSTHTKQVCVGTKTVSEQQCVGYEKLPTTTETYVDHYECSCGAIKDQVSHGE